MSYADQVCPKSVQPGLPMFWQALQRGWLFRLFAHLTRRSERLIDLEETLCCAHISNAHAAGRQAVEIDQIRGTQGKAEDFDAQFYPLRETVRTRWLSIAGERLRGHDLPPVELVEVEGIYYVRDGHHRISVARSLGQAFIDAEITHLRLEHTIQ